MYKTIFIDSMVRGVGKTIGTLVVFGAVALTWYTGTELYTKTSFTKKSKHAQTFSNKESEASTQTNDKYESDNETNKYKAILNNLIM
jgi:hypothetical protein